MRVLAATGIAIALAAIAGAAEASELSIYRGPCGEMVLPKVPPGGVDAAIRVDTKCGAFVIHPQGVRHVGRAGPSQDGPLSFQGRLLFYERGGLARTLASLARSHENVPLEDGRVALVGRRLVVLGSSGAVIASDRRRGSLPTLSSSHGEIALISTGPPDERGRASESVRLLRAGERSSTPLFVNDVGALGCGHWPSLAWRGHQILYSTTAGDVVVIDADSRKHVDLTAAILRLPGEFVGARWA